MKANQIKHLFLTLLLGAFLLLLWKQEVAPFYDFSLRFDDINYKFHEKKPSDDILFVAIDEQSVNKLGRWPWDRQKVAKGLHYLQEAKVVVFDMVFSEPTNDQSDSALGDAIAQTNSICGFFLRKKATQKLGEVQKELLLDSAAESIASKELFVHGEYVEANIPAVFENCTLQAAFSTMRESDHLFRNYPLAFEYDGSYYPSLGVQAMRFVLDKDLFKESDSAISLNGRLIPFNRNGFTRLNYYKEEYYQRISFYDLYSGQVDPGLIKDKIVILGITEAGVEDVRATPIGAVPGPLLHYTFISNYLQDDLLHPVDTVALSAALLFLMLPFLISFVMRKIISRVIVYIAVMGTYLVLSKLLYIYINVWLETFYPVFFLLASVLMSEVYAFMTQEKEAKFIQGAFSSYLSPILLKKLKSTPELLNLYGEVKEMTIFFSDIRSFTTISESMRPEELVKLLNRYFTPMANIVRDNEGMLDKYIGDAIMAFFNAPLDVEDHAKKACRCSIQMIEHLELLNQELVAEGFAPIAIGIGLNTAEVTVGNMGSDDRFNYTVIGDGVNLASRVEGLNKAYRTQILITENTYKQLDDEFVCRRLEAVKVKGKDEAVVLYELMLDRAENREIRDAFEGVLELFEEHNFEASAQGFERLYKKYDDPVSQLFYEKSIEYMKRLATGEDVSVAVMKTK